MEISSGACPQAALAKATHPRQPLARWPAAPALEAAPPGTRSGFRLGTWPLPYPQGLTFTAFLSLFFKS